MSLWNVGCIKKMKLHKHMQATNQNRRNQTCCKGKLNIIVFFVSKLKFYDGGKLARWYNYPAK